MRLHRAFPRAFRPSTFSKLARQRRTEHLLRKAACETLERRTLLTTLTGGSVFEFLDAHMIINRVAVIGPSTMHVELIGVNTRKTADPVLDAADGQLNGQAAVLTNISGSDRGIPLFGGLDPMATTGTNLFAIYVTGSDSSSYISIAQVPALTARARPMQPFSGDPGTIQVFPAQGGDLINASFPNSVGAVYIGARTIDSFTGTTDEENFAILRLRRKPGQLFGDLPTTVRNIDAGVTVIGDMARLLIGGVVTGRVQISGNIETFYAGAILTGDAQGRGQGSSFADVAGNFAVTGDIRNLITNNDFGSSGIRGGNDRDAPLYLTGFDLKVGGHVSQIKGLDGFVGSMEVQGVGKGTPVDQEEVETHTTPLTGSQSYFQGNVDIGRPAPSLGDSGAYRNDNFDSAQILGTAANIPFKSNEVVQLNGEINNVPRSTDGADYYGISLLAGQSITTQLTATAPPGFVGLAALQVGVFDSDRRLIATDYSKTHPEDVKGQPFRFTADRPGTYYFAVATTGDFNFNGTGDPGVNGDLVVLGVFEYRLTVSGLSNITLGGVVAGTGVFTDDPGTSGIIVDQGDLGTVITQGGGSVFSLSQPWQIRNGNFRSIESASLGFVVGPSPDNGSTEGPSFLVPNGTVGLLRATGAPGTFDVLNVNQLIPPLSTTPNGGPIPNAADAIGGDYQLIDAPNTRIVANLLADKSIGIIRGVNTGGINDLPGAFYADADLTGRDGIIDLIDMSSSLGTLQSGGPAIRTGPGGNVRYIHVPNTPAALFSSVQFGSGARQPTVFAPGQTVDLVDDSGTQFTLSPTPQVPNLDPTSPTPFVNPGTLEVLTYGIDSGGIVVVRVQVDPPPTLITGNHGLLVTSRRAGGATGGVEIGEIISNAPGRQISETEDPIAGTPSISVPDRRDDVINDVTPDLNTPVDIVLTGDSVVDVWTITGTRIDSIQSSGEIANIRAQSVGDLGAQRIGVTVGHTGADVNGTTVLGGLAAPFNGVRKGILLTGGAPNSYLVTARAREAIGNVYVNGIIGNITANSNNRNIKGRFEGINAPIVASATAATTSARIQSVNIGEGILPSGTGFVPTGGGIWAGSTLGSVTNQGLGSDIRGDIVVGFDLPPIGLVVDQGQIGSIRLTNGAIIKADILVQGLATDFQEFPRAVAIIERQNDTFDAPRNEIGSISINGIGGIIGSLISAADIGPVKINGGFGVVTTTFNSVGDNRISGIDTTGYGIRGSIIGGGAAVSRLVARGDGKQIDTNSYTGSVRMSGVTDVDPFFGTTPNELTDLHKYLGTSAKAGKKKGISNSGLIEDVTASGTRELNVLQAFRLQRRRLAMTLDFANRVQWITTGDTVDGLILTTGNMDHFITGNDVWRSDLNIRGTGGDINIGGTFRGSSNINSTGSEGRLVSLRTKRALYATIDADVAIDSIIVGTSIGSPHIRTLGNLGLLQVGDSILTGSDVRTSKTLSSIIVPDTLEAGATVRARKIEEQQIGTLEGDLVVG